MITKTENCDLSRLTTFGVSAQARILITYDDPQADLPALRAQGVFDGPYIHIGGGSNMLFDGPYDGVVLKSEARNFACHATGDGEGDCYYTFDAGLTLDEICHALTRQGLWGMENLSGIPGTIGGAAVQNVGAYGVEFKDVATGVTVFDTLTGETRRLSVDECGYGYRWSMFKSAESAGRYIVTRVSLKVSHEGEPRLGYGHLKSAVDEIAAGAPVTPMMVRQAVIAMRDSKLPDPALVGSAGSYFKNPEMTPEAFNAIVDKARAMWGDDVTVPHYIISDDRIKVPAAWFIDRCGWKGHKNGGAAVWEKQPLVLVNLSGDATAADILGLQKMITDDINSKFGITLKPEVVIVKSKS